jgi:ketosteroid isomerase-like protein
MTLKNIHFSIAITGLIIILLFCKGVLAMTPTEFFRNLNSTTMSTVLEFYKSDAVFVDPLGKIEGADKIQAYYAYQYKNAQKISWTIEPEIISGKTRVLVWTMHLTAAELNGGKPFDVQGMSRFTVESDGKVSFHQDYFDVGAFVYERVPVLKNIIFFVKDRMKKGLHEYNAASH